MTDPSIAAFASANYNRAKAALRTFDALPIGIVRDSGNAGDQEDFGWHGESLDPVGCEVNRIAVAATWPKWPCHHREHDGSPCDPATRPGAIIWKGRATMHGPDRLGKPRDIMLAESYGWSGPDDEHWSISRLYEAVVSTGCPALQEVLAQQARLLIWDCSRTPGWFTTGPRAARSRGWRALAAVRIYDALSDRTLAGQCLEAVWFHARGIWPSMHRSHPSGFTDVRFNAVGPGAWALLWQEAVYAYGLDRLAETVEEAWGPLNSTKGQRESAHLLANAVFKHGYTELPDGSWRTREYLPLDAGVTPPAWNDDFNYFGMALAPAVLLRHRPDHPEARRCIDWLVKNEPDAGSLEWIAPEVV